MTAKRRGLGKGLNALLAATLTPSDVKDLLPVTSGLPESDLTSITSHTAPETNEGLVILDVDKIHSGPYQPRQSIRHEGIEQLAESIRAQGIIQPIVVRKAADSSYEIIAGERRWRAAQLAGFTTVPAIIKDISELGAMAVALIENIQREDLTPIEEAKALKRLSEEMQLTHLQVAEAVGKSRASVTNLLRLLTLNLDVQNLLEEGKLEMGHARALLGVKGQLQSQVAATIAERGLSVRETERIIAKLQENPATPANKVEEMDPNIRRLQEDLSDKLGAPVFIRHSNRKGQGMVVIRYNDVDELEGILAHIK